MPARSKDGRRIVGLISSTVLWKGADDPRLPGLRRDLRAAEAEVYIQELVDAAPPLTDEQRTHLADLLRPNAGGSA